MDTDVAVVGLPIVARPNASVPTTAAIIFSVSRSTFSDSRR